MVEPQQALFVHSPFENIPPDVGRVYAGAEFCPWRLPALPALEGILRATRETGRPFTLVTPVLIEPVRESLRATLAGLLPLFGPDDEVVISDWGALELVRAVRPEVTVVLGRVLSGQKRDARTVSLDLSPAQLEHFREGSWYSAPAVELLLELGIERVELDNPLQGVASLPVALRGTLHTPYAMVASSRNCPFRAAGSFGPCSSPCGEAFSLRSVEDSVPLLQGGNTQFLCNAALPNEPLQLGIDRIVRHAELPR